MTKSSNYKSYLKASTGVLAIMLMNTFAGTAQAQTAPAEDEIIFVGLQLLMLALFRGLWLKVQK